VQQSRQRRELWILAQLEGNPALSIMRLWRPRGYPPSQQVLLYVRWQTNVDTVWLVNVSERFAAYPKLKIVSARVVRLHTWNKKHFSDDYLQKPQGKPIILESLSVFNDIPCSERLTPARPSKH
jgi:hypothetical protein